MALIGALDDANISKVLNKSRVGELCAPALGNDGSDRLECADLALESRYRPGRQAA
jgi:hypothetical protein